MLSQILLLCALLLISYYLLKAKPSVRSQAIRRLVLIFAIFAGIVLVIVPDLLFRTAGLIGIAQGTDLLLYLFLLAMLFYIVHQYRRMIWFDKVSTDLAREVALLRFELKKSQASATESQPPAKRKTSP
jgi:small membrane protein